MHYIIMEQENLNLVDPVECDTVPEIQETILEKIKNGRTPRVFVEVPFDVTIKVREGNISEVKKSKTESDQGPGAESHRKVRSGDKGAAEEVGPGSGDDQPGPGAGD